MAIGDPQASFEKFLRILDRHGLLGEDGRLRTDVSLLSAGDHFDYDGDPRTVAEDGLRLLRWLAEHPPDQVVLLAGNHDLSRVIELWRQTDASYARARELAREILALGSDPSRSLEAIDARRRFTQEHPDIPTPGVAVRDYGSFTEAQRALVQALLLSGRLSLAHAVRLQDGRPLLATHASVTARELGLIGLPEDRRPVVLAERLQRELEEAVERVRGAWTGGEMAPLDLRPLHVGGERGREGGGLLYHRPAHPGQDGPDRSWGHDGTAPRRFDPRTLPLGLLQVCGHIGHRKCLIELDGWATPAARKIARGGLRTLRTDGVDVIYEPGIAPVPAAEAGLYMIDGEMNRVEVEEYPVLELSLDAPRD